ncbi:MAG TPA: hypothetical protein VF160_02135 [Candidatus Dormibacteraeota bacterium]
MRRGLLAAAALLGLALTFHPVVEGDGVNYFAYLHSIVVDRDLDLSDEYRAAAAAQATVYLENVQSRTSTGLAADYVPIGSTLLALPAYLAALALHPSGEPQFGAPFTTAFTLASLLFGLLALALGYRLAQGLEIDARSAAMGAVGAGLATPLLYYLLYDPSYSHTFSAFETAAFVCVWWITGAGRGWRAWLLLGVLAGLMSTVRIQDGAVAAIVVLDLPRARLRALAALPGTVVGFLPQALAEHTIFGTWTPGRPPEYQRLDLFPGHYLAELLSSHNGLLVWSPAVVVAAFGIWKLGDRRFQLAAVIALVVEVAANGVQGDWWGGYSFGMRRLCDLTIFFEVGWAAVGSLWITAAFAAWNFLEAANFRYVIPCCDRDPGYLGLLRGQLEAVRDLPRMFGAPLHNGLSLPGDLLLVALQAVCLGAAITLARSRWRQGARASSP